MKQLPLKLQAPILMMLILLISSCSTDSPDNPQNEENSANSILLNTKWTTQNFDYDVADDYSWAYAFSEITNVYFYSKSEGVLYHSRKTTDSDSGSRRDSYLVFFKYEVIEDRVVLDAITVDYYGLPNSFSLKNNNISTPGFTFKKAMMSGADKQWLNGYTGTTGNCHWYHDNVRRLSICGTGPMGDYSSYSQTPWKNRVYNSLYIDKNVTSIGSHAFEFKSLSEVKFEDGRKIKQIGSYAFSNSLISKLSLPDNVTKIGDGAFSGCTYAAITLPQNVEEIGEASFSSCKSVDMSRTPKLRKIGNKALMFTFDFSFSNSEVIESIGSGALYFRQGQYLSLNLPAIKELGNGAITSFRTNNEIHIGGSLTKVEGTPIAGAENGKLYINNSTPLPLSANLVANPKGWDLYVPQNSVNTYKRTNYWANFKSINGDSSLNGNPSDNPNVDGDDFFSSLTITPSIFSVKISGKISDWAYNKYIANDKYKFLFLAVRNKKDRGESVKIKEQEFSVNIGYLAANTDYTLTIEKAGVAIKESKTYSFETLPSKTPSSCPYSINGANYKMVKVTGLPQGDYYIMQTELRHDADLVMNGRTISLHIDKNKDNYVTMAEFADFLHELRSITGINFRLPTPTEWVYAAKGGQNSKGYTYSGSNVLKEVGWYKDNYLKSNRTYEIALLKPNEIGLYDMSGNLAEITQTFYVYEKEPFDLNGDIYGGYHHSYSSECTPESFKTHIKMFEPHRYYGFQCAVRLVYSAQ